MSAHSTITRAELLELFELQQPNNDDAEMGYALVNVLQAEAFTQAHIPGSINIPMGLEEAFERRFAKNKAIVVYCDSPVCEASPKVATELARRGFKYVRTYEGGLDDWKDGDQPVQGTHS